VTVDAFPLLPPDWVLPRAGLLYFIPWRMDRRANWGQPLFFVTQEAYDLDHAWGVE
jgi:hypothetical protein